MPLCLESQFHSLFRRDIYLHYVEIVDNARQNGKLPKFVVPGSGLYIPETITVPKVQWLDSIWEAYGYDTVAKMDRMLLLKRPDLRSDSVNLK